VGNRKSKVKDPPQYLLSSYQIGKPEYERLIQAVFPESQVEDLRPANSFFSFSADLFPGNDVFPERPVFLAFVEGFGGNITSQIAVRMALDAMKTEALSFSSKSTSAGESKGGKNNSSRIGLEFLQSAFREANQQVYQYGHRMLAGGHLGAMAMLLVFDGKKCSLGRVGSYGAFLWRQGKLQPFYESPAEREVHSKQPGMRDHFIGANAQILVDLAAVSMRDGDVVVLTSLATSEKLFAVGEKVLREMTSLDEAVKEFSYEMLGSLVEEKRLFFQSQQMNLEMMPQASARPDDLILEKNILVFMLQVGQPTIILREVVTTQ